MQKLIIDLQFLFAEIPTYCTKNLNEIVSFSNPLADYSTEIGASVKMSCITGYETYEKVPLVAECVEDSDLKGQWHVSSSCQREHI